MADSVETPLQSFRYVAFSQGDLIQNNELRCVLQQSKKGALETSILNLNEINFFLFDAESSPRAHMYAPQTKFTMLEMKPRCTFARPRAAQAAVALTTANASIPCGSGVESVDTFSTFMGQAGQSDEYFPKRHNMRRTNIRQQVIESRNTTQKVYIFRTVERAYQLFCTTDSDCANNKRWNGRKD